MLGLSLLCIFSFISFIHSITFFHTLCHFPGGATSAGVFKALQVVLIFVFTDWVYCGRIGGEEMCFSKAKFFSLITIAGGAILHGMVAKESEKKNSSQGYENIEEVEAIKLDRT